MKLNSNNMEKVAIITGGSKGIGKSVIDLFKSEGIICYDFSRSTNKIDITDEKSVEMNVESVIRKHGKIDILVNNAGIVSTTDILDMSLIEWKNIIDVNLTGMFIMTKSVLKYMKEEQYGKIVNVSSIAGTDRSKVASVAYTSSKHGVIGFTRQLSLSYAKHGININCVAPSQTKTEMLTNNISEEDIKKIRRSSTK